MSKRISVNRLRLKKEGTGLKHYARKYWYVFFLIAIFSVSLWFRTIPGRWNELIGLDEFHIYRIADYALHHNLQIPNAQNLDMMRYVPLGVPTDQFEYPMPFYLPVLAYIFFSALGLATPFFEFAIFFPAFLGAIGCIIAFFLAKDLFKSNVSGLFAAFFVSLTPALFTRTSAASFEKEATAVIFMMAAVWLFVRAYNKEGKSAWFYGMLSGVSLALMGMSWGGIQYIFLLFSAFLFTLFAANIVLVILDYLFPKSFGKRIENLEKFLGPKMLRAYVPMILLGTFIPMITPLHQELTSMAVLAALSAMAILLVRYGALKLKLVSHQKSHYIIPAIVVIAVVGLFASSMFSDFVDNELSGVTSLLTLSKSVIGSTVAENAPGDWSTITSTLGTSFASGALPQLSFLSPLFALWIFMFLGAFLMIYEIYRTQDWMLLLPLVWLGSTLFSIFWMVRLLFILGPAAGIVGAFFFGWSANKLRKTKYFNGKTLRSRLNFVSIPVIALVILLVVINVAATFVYAVSINTAICFPKYKDQNNPNPFDVVPCVTLDQNGNQVLQDGQPWYEAMNFLSQQTPQGSVILSWWDFGYWFQTRGMRPSVADGGNLQGIYFRNYQLADWYTDNSKNWSAWVPWMEQANVSYIFMDYTLPGKYGAITTIGSRGTKPIGLLEFQRSGMYPKDNITTIEYTSGQYAIWLPFDSAGSLTGPPRFLISQNGKYYSNAYINDVCTTNGIIHVGNDTTAMPGCVAISPIGVYYVPPEAENTIFVDLMFMQGHDLPVEKVFDNTYVQVYRVNYQSVANVTASSSAA